LVINRQGRKRTRANRGFDSISGKKGQNVKRACRFGRRGQGRLVHKRKKIKKPLSEKKKEKHVTAGSHKNS